MSEISEPSEHNLYLTNHVQLLRDSFQLLTGRELIPPELQDVDAAKSLYLAPYIVVSHGSQVEPIFNYGNREALALFEMSWAEFTALPSRQSAEEPNQEARSQLLKEVSLKGYIDHYSGVRISKTGKRFWIDGATVWNLIDAQGAYWGQAATWQNWRYL